MFELLNLQSSYFLVVPGLASAQHGMSQYEMWTDPLSSD